MTEFKNRINLQLFAEPNTQTTATESLTAEMKTFYSKDLIETVGANLVHAQFGEETSLPAHGGKVIEWRRWAKFKKALTPLVEGVTPDGTPFAVGTVQKKLEQFGDYTTVSDILELTAIDNIILELTAKHAENASLTLDTIVRNDLVAGCTTIIHADKVAADGTKTAIDTTDLLDGTCLLTPDNVARAAATLKKANAPKIDGSYVAIVHPSVAYDLMRNPDWIDVNKYSNAIAIFNGEIGKLYGVRFVESTEAIVFRGTAINLTVSAFDAATMTVTCSAEVGNIAGKRILIKVDDNVYLPAFVESVNGKTFVLEGVEPEDAANITSGNTITSGESGANGCAIYGTIFLGKGAYKVVKLDNKNMEVIVKQRGSAGTADPIDQRSTVGWMANGYGAQVTIPEYIVMVYSGSFYSEYDSAN